MHASLQIQTKINYNQNAHSRKYNCIKHIFITTQFLDNFFDWFIIDRKTCTEIQFQLFSRFFPYMNTQKMILFSNYFKIKIEIRKLDAYNKYFELQLNFDYL